MKLQISYTLNVILIGILLLLGGIFNIMPTTIWLLCYSIIILTLKGKDPLDPRLWLLIPWEVLFTNAFSGVRYIPPLDFVEPISYALLVISCYFLGFKLNNSAIVVDSYKIQSFLQNKASYKGQHFIKWSGLLGVLGAGMILFEMFVLLGFSLDGGDRRAEFQENFGNFSALTAVGMLLLGGCYPSVLSVFFHGNKQNMIIGSISFLAVGLYSVAIGGKQGIFLALLLLIFCYSCKRVYQVKIKVPFVVKCIIFSIFFFFSIYITGLSSSRNQNVDDGELLSNTELFSREFIEGSAHYLPKSIQNTFAEVFGYYGDQIGCFSERWTYDDYPQLFSIVEMPPRVLEPFVWIKRQIQKVFPIYDMIFPSRLGNNAKRIQMQSNGYYGLANWQTTLKMGLGCFGFIGQMIVAFYHGFFSKKWYTSFLNNPTYAKLNILVINSLFSVYTIMMNVLGETSVLVYLMLTCYLYRKEIKYKNYIVK